MSTVSDILMVINRVRKILLAYDNGNLCANHFDDIHDLLLGYEEELLKKKVVG